MSDVESRIAARILAAKQRRATRRRQREELDEARGYGLASRHAAKMRRWAREDDQ